MFDKLKENGITHVIETAIDMENNFRMRKIFINSDMVSFGAGIHPLRVAYANHIYGQSICKNIILELIQAPKTVAVGKTGLDFHRGCGHALFVYVNRVHPYDIYKNNVI